MRAARLCIRTFLSLAAGIVTFFFVHATFVFGAGAIYDKDIGSVRFAQLDGTIGFPVSALGAVLVTYFTFLNRAFLNAKVRLRH